MKRSEMIRNLENELRDVVAKNHIDKMGYEWVANLLLIKIEESGMLPPNFTGILESETQEDGSITLTLWGWEAEND